MSIKTGTVENLSTDSWTQIIPAPPTQGQRFYIQEILFNNRAATANMMTFRDGSGDSAKPVGYISLPAAIGQTHIKFANPVPLLNADQDLDVTNVTEGSAVDILVTGFYA